MSTPNLSGLQQKADNTLFTADEFVQKWREFLTAPAGQVSMKYYDRNGNLQTATFSNRNKLVQDFIVNVNSAMSKTFYVDQMNGNDANDGSQVAPFATPQKAVDSVPAGGVGVVIFKTDIELGTNLYVKGKIIFFISADSSSKITISNKETVTNLNGTDYRNTTAIVVRNSHVIFLGTNLNHIEMTSSLNTLSYGAYMIKADASFVHFRNCDISIGSDPSQSLVLTDTWEGSSAFVSFRNSTITTNGGVVFRLLNNSGGSLFVGNTSISDGTKWTAGVIKDANGTPRNVLSNIIL